MKKFNENATTKLNQQLDYKLDAEEQAILNAYEANDLRSTLQNKESILHKYASGRLLEKPSNLSKHIA